MSARRRELVDAARGMFNHRGYRAVSMDEIAAVVGISGPALYRHFRGKQDLLVAVIDDALSVVESAIGDAASASQMLEALATMGAGSSWFGSLLQRELRYARADEVRALEARVHGVRRRIADSLVESSPDPSTRDLTARLALAVAGSTAYYESELPEDERRQVLGRMLLGLADGRTVPRPARPETQSAVSVRDWLPRREAILAAAPGVLQGMASLDDVTLEDFASAAGIAPPSFYGHFPSKRHLLDALVERADRWALASLEQAMATATDGPDVMRRALGGYVHLVEQIPSFAVPMLPPDAQETDQISRMTTRYLAAWMVCAQAARPSVASAELEVLLRGALAVVNELRNPASTSAESLEADALSRVALAVFRA